MKRSSRAGGFGVRRQLSYVLLLAIAGASLGPSPSVAQSVAVTTAAPGNATEAAEDAKAYAAAIAANAGGDVLALERYASTAPDGQHRKDALMWLAATYRDMKDSERATKWASDLLRAEPDNALGLAVVANADSQLTLTSPSEPGADQPLSQAKQALRGLDRLRKPEGMQDEAFESLKGDLARTLNGAVGYAYFQRKDYVTARTFLRRAATLSPNNPQYTYSLALADLEGRDGDQQEGFKMLARSVNLTQGTPSGSALAQYAAQKYKFAGGTDANWQRFLAVTKVSPTERTAELASARVPLTSGVAAASPIATQPATAAATTSASAPPSPTPTTASAAPSAAPTAPTATAAATNATPTTGSSESVASNAASSSTTSPTAATTAASPTMGPATTTTMTVTAPSVPSPTTSATATAPPATSPTISATAPGFPAPAAPASAPTANPATAPNGNASSGTLALPSAATPPTSSSTASASNPSFGGTAATANRSTPNTANVNTTPAPEPPRVVADASVPNTTGAVPPLPDLPSAPEPRLPPRAPIRIYGPDKPVSLGILIETATTSRESRANVVNALGDMVRRLRQKDEAFLVSFSNQVVFEQDLTNNADALVETMDKIKPQPGTALFDAVAFAAGHLKRVAANENRALLVISDGSSTTTQVSPLELSGELGMSAVRIYCIGLQVDSPENQQRLTALANATGGRAIFVPSAAGFRGAAREVATGLGLPF